MYGSSWLNWLEHCSPNAETMGSNPVEVSNLFGLICNYHCDDHIFIYICIPAVPIIILSTIYLVLRLSLYSYRPFPNFNHSNSPFISMASESSTDDSLAQPNTTCTRSPGEQNPPLTNHSLTIPWQELIKTWGPWHSYLLDWVLHYRHRRMQETVRVNHTVRRLPAERGLVAHRFVRMRTTNSAFMRPVRIARLIMEDTTKPGAPQNVSKYARSVSNGFLCALEPCLVNMALPKKLFICSEVSNELWLSRKF